MTNVSEVVVRGRTCRQCREAEWTLVLVILFLISGLDGRVSRGTSGGQRLPPQPELMGLWIDGRQIERFAGVPMDIYIIKNGAVVSYLQDTYNIDSKLPVLPPEVFEVELSWLAELEPFTYKFSDLKSLDTNALYNPLLSIPVMGLVPRKKSEFRLSMPCTGRVTGTASMYIVLHVYNSRTGENVIGSPLKFHLRKRCVATEIKKRSCRLSCQNGGKCNEAGRCDCRPGYYGHKCELALCARSCMNSGTCITPDTCQCKPTHYGEFCQFETGTCEVPCINGGTCNHYNVCSCQEGYAGQFCQKSMCQRWCGVHGKCVQHNLCECHRGWRGKLCNKTVKLSDQPPKDGNSVNRRRKRRKLRHSAAPAPLTPFRFDPRRGGGGVDGVALDERDEGRRRRDQPRFHAGSGEAVIRNEQPNQQEQQRDVRQHPRDEKQQSRDERQSRNVQQPSRGDRQEARDERPPRRRQQQPLDARLRLENHNEQRPTSLLT